MNYRPEIRLSKFSKMIYRVLRVYARALLPILWRVAKINDLPAHRCFVRPRFSGGDRRPLKYSFLHYF